MTEEFADAFPFILNTRRKNGSYKHELRTEHSPRMCGNLEKFYCNAFFFFLLFSWNKRVNGNRYCDLQGLDYYLDQ